MKTASLCVKSCVSLLLGAVFMVVPFVASAATIFGSQTIDTIEAITYNVPWLSASFTSAASGTVRSIVLDYDATTTVNGVFQVILKDNTLGRWYVVDSTAVIATTSSLYLGTGKRTISMLNCYDILYSVSYAGGCPVNGSDSMTITASGSGNSAAVYFRGKGTAQSDAYFLVGDTAVIDWGALYVPVVFSSSTAAIATSSGLWNSLTLASSTAQCNSGNLFTDGLCAAGTFLFIPNVDILNGFFTIPTTAATKFPFSWIYGVKTEFNSLSVSSTTAMTTLSYNFHDLGIGSTTPMGNILPNVEVFSKNTIETYISPSLWSTFQTLIATALWLSFFWFEFNRARRMSRPTTS